MLKSGLQVNLSVHGYETRQALISTFNGISHSQYSHPHMPYDNLCLVLKMVLEMV